MIDGFAAEPGTVAGRDEFRGTSGSLYFLRRQDILKVPSGCASRSATRIQAWCWVSRT